MRGQITKPYLDFSDFIGRFFPGKMQKISVNAGLGCPNRDGTIGKGGCIYCDNRSFSPAYTRSLPSIKDQIERGKQFFARKYPQMRFLAYFQSYTNTHGDNDSLLRLYREALEVDKIDGIIIATRPDCMDDSLLEELKKLSQQTFVMIEFGAETSHDQTLKLINRCHTWNQTVSAVIRTKRAGIPIGLHFINGLPGEDMDLILETIDHINQLPVDIVKFHQLQVIKGTQLHSGVEQGLYDIPRWTAEDYVNLCCLIVKKLRADIAIERFVSQSPDDMLVFPRWGLKNYQFTNLLHRRLSEIL